MSVTDAAYVREREGTHYVGDTRVALSSLTAAWKNEGYTAEELRQGFPALSLAQVYGAIAYYLDHQSELGAAFTLDDERYWQQRDRDRDADPGFCQRLNERREHLRLRLSRPGEPAPSDAPQTDDDVRP